MQDFSNEIFHRYYKELDDDDLRALTEEELIKEEESEKVVETPPYCDGPYTVWGDTNE
jgi:hypothetical protein